MGRQRATNKKLRRSPRVMVEVFEGEELVNDREHHKKCPESRLRPI
jgi:hypothetical protein